MDLELILFRKLYKKNDFLVKLLLNMGLNLKFKILNLK
jgi:hypothetical protein